MTPISPLNPVVAERQEKTLSKVDESYDDDEATAAMDLTGCVDSFHHIQHLTGFAPPNYGTNTDAVHTTTCGNNSLIDSRDPLHPNFEVEPMDMDYDSLRKQTSSGESFARRGVSSKCPPAGGEF